MQSCSTDCADGTREDQTRALGCTRFRTPATWPVRVEAARLWLGARATETEERPPEDVDEVGCPAGYQYGAFAQSVFRYARTGGRSNPLLDRSDDDLVHEAVACLESHLDRREGHTQELVNG